MNKQVQDILNEAHTTGQLAALHIDLKNKFHPDVNKSMLLGETPQTKQDLAEAFTSAAKFKDELKNINVPNIWLAYISGKHNYQHKPHRAKDMVFVNPKDDFYIATPCPDDLILTKKYTGLLNDKQEYDQTESLPTTLIVDGVYAEGCVMHVISDMFNIAQEKSRPLKVIVAHDATDNKYPDGYLRDIHLSIRSKTQGIYLGADSKHQVTMATTQQIISALKPSLPNAP